VTHTLNLRLHPDDNTYIATHGGDRVLIVDKVLWPLAEPFVSRCSFDHVIAVGAGKRLEDGRLIPMDVKVGDKVIYGKWSGTEVKLDGKDHVILKEEDLFGILG